MHWDLRLGKSSTATRMAPSIGTREDRNLYLLDHGSGNDFMKAIIRYIILAVLFIFPGCSKDSQIELFNNTNSQIEVRFGANQIVIENRSSILFSFDSAARGVTISKNGRKLIYRFPFMSRIDTYGYWRHGSTDVLRVQLDTNSFIYVVSPQAQLPALSHIKQPSGFPLQPIVHQ